jgi:DNA-binding XRE family transcriptional regulator
MLGNYPTQWYSETVIDERTEEDKLGALAKKFRQAARKTRAAAARELGVARPTIFQAEEEPEQGLLKLRKRIIEEYSEFEVSGPFYILTRKR